MARTSVNELFDPSHGFDVPPEDAFETALNSSIAVLDTPIIINVHLNPGALLPAMRRSTKHLTSRIGGGRHKRPRHLFELLGRTGGAAHF
jgi:hypothetical protein